MSLISSNGAGAKIGGRAKLGGVSGLAGMEVI